MLLIFKIIDSVRRFLWIPQHWVKRNNMIDIVIIILSRTLQYLEIWCALFNLPIYESNFCHSYDLFLLIVGWDQPGQVFLLDSMQKIKRWKFPLWRKMLYFQTGSQTDFHFQDWSHNVCGTFMRRLDHFVTRVRVPVQNHQSQSGSSKIKYVEEI